MDECKADKERDKVVAKARNWASSRRAKAAATGPDRERAQSRHRVDGNELAEAVEKLEKSFQHRST